MEFPPFEHLRFYEGVHDVRLNISYSNIKGFTLGEFHKPLPKDLDLNWTDGRGPPELRRLIAQHAQVAMDHVLVTTGATEANFLANVALVQPRDRVVVDTPNYSPLRDCAVGLGADVVPVVRDCHDGWSLDLDRFRRTAGGRAKLLVFANLNNPTSVPLGRNDLQELADIAQECDGYVLVDETFRELAFHHPPPSVAEFGPRMKGEFAERLIHEDIAVALLRDVREFLKIVSSKGDGSGVVQVREHEEFRSASGRLPKSIEVEGPSVVAIPHDRDDVRTETHGTIAQGRVVGSVDDDAIPWLDQGYVREEVRLRGPCGHEHVVHRHLRVLRDQPSKFRRTSPV